MNLFARLVCYAFMAYVVLPESYVSRYLLVELEPDYEPEPQPWYNQPPVTTTLPPVPETTTTDGIPLEETEPVALGRSMGGGRPKRPAKEKVKKQLYTEFDFYQSKDQQSAIITK